jgi:hypothetical protein
MFRTELSLRPAAQPLSQGARVLTIGSCFSDVIGERLAGHKVRALTNPFGTVFNPLAAARLLRAVAGEDTDWQQHLVEARGRWQSYDLHATVGADSPPALLERIEQTVRETAEFARTADVLVWTLGTAYGYRLRDTGEVVNNCHKIPADRFEKELLTAEEIVSAVTEAYALLRQQNPKLRLVLTVSPVRHLKDTLPLNAVSKSVLRVACHYLSELLPGASYFPAYELLLDDLRDYRFYAADMLHPSEVAEQYVWEKFVGVYFDGHFKQFVQEWDGIQRALQHQPLHEGAPEHREFLQQTQQRLERILSRGVDVRLELLDVQDRLDALPAPPAPAEPEELDDDEERIDIGYEDAPAAPKPVVLPPVPVKTEPTWAEILSAEAKQADDEEDEEDEAEEAGTGNEAEAALPGEAGAAKRRKRKRGGRKHKKKNNRLAAEETAAGAVVAEASAADELPAGAPGTEEAAPAATPAAVPAEAASEPTPAPALPPVEQPAVGAPQPAGKRRNRPNRKKPALYAEQPAATETPAATVVPVINTPPIVEEPGVAASAAAALQAAAAEAPPVPAPVAAPTEEAPAAPGEAPATAETPARAKSRRAPRRKPAAPAAATQEDAPASLPLPEVPAVPVLPEAAASAPEPPASTPEPAAPETPAPRRRAAPRRKPAAAAPAAEAPAPEAPAPEPAPTAPKRRRAAPRRKPDEPADNS